MALSQEQQIKKLEKDVKELQSLLGGLTNDLRLQNTIRNAVIIGEHVAGKPIIINAQGKRYNLQTV